MITSLKSGVLRSSQYEVPRQRFMTGRIDLKLDGNEGRAPSAAILEAAWARLAESPGGGIHRYPDRSELESVLAELSGVSADRVFAGAGVDDILERLTRQCSTGSAVVTTPPTFEMIPRYLRESGLANEQQPWMSGPYPTARVIERARRARAALVFAVSPNNPTGAVLTPEDLTELAEALPDSTIVLDLVYGEFAEVDLLPTALAFDNVAVCRSLSKAWGIAGARIGWLIADPSLVAQLRSTGSPYPIAAPSIAIACELLSRGRSSIADYVARVRSEREELFELCEQLGLSPLRSEGNFLLVRSPKASRLWFDLASLGIAVRRFVGRDGLENALRITLPGDEEEFERLTEALRTSLAPRALLFDMDGVLVDVSRSFREAVLQTAKSFGVELTRDEVAARKAQGNANDDWELTRSLIEQRGVVRSLAEVTARFEELYQGTENEPGLRATESPLVDANLLSRLSARRPLGVVTGRPRRDAMRFLNESGLRDYFSCVIAREDAPLKPSPEPVRCALDALEVETAWMVGDTPDDLTAARAAGVLPLGIAAPGEDASALQVAGAARVLKKLEDLEGELS